MRITLCKGQLHGTISGADETLVTYATELKRMSFDVSVLLLYRNSNEDNHYKRLKEAAVPVHIVASSSVEAALTAGRNIARGLLRVLPSTQILVRSRGQKIATNIAGRYFEACRDYLQTSQPDLVHVLTPDPAASVIISAAHAAKIPILYQELGMPYHPPAYESYYQQFTEVLPLCTEVAALSPLLAEECRLRFAHPNKLSVLPITTEPPVVNGANGSGPTINIGFAGRIEHLKGPLVLLEAFALAIKECSNLKLRIAGTGSEAPKISVRAKELGVGSRCELTGVYTTNEQRNAFMSSLHMFALSSFSEGTPNSIAEAMSHGLPVVASSVGGIPDVLTQESGILVPPGDPVALSRALVQLASDVELRKRMGKGARSRYEKLFSPTSVMPLLLETYRRVASAKSMVHTASESEYGQRADCATSG